MSKDIFEIINPTNTLGVCRPLAHILGACETIVYNALLSKYRYYQKNDMLDDGWFYSTIPDLFESTSFSAFRQKRCITTLESFGLIETKNRGLPARRSFRIINDLELIAKLVAKGEEIMRSAKIEAVLSYEKKRKHSDESDLSESSYTDEEEETVFTEDAASVENIEEIENSNPCSEETEQQAPKELNNLLQRNCETCSEVFTAPSSLYKTTDNKTSVNNHQSINQQAAPDKIDRIDMPQPSPVVSSSKRAEYLELIKENIDYDCLVEQNRNRKDRIDEILHLMVDVVSSNRFYIRVNGEDFPQEVVKSQFLKLDSGHIEYVIMAMDRCPSDIRNIRSYLITTLYNAPYTIGSFFSAMVNHDMHG